MIHEPHAYHEFGDRKVSREHCCELAEAAWIRQKGNQSLSCDYADGFKHGYAEYIYAGGSAPPPPLPLPPRKYWNDAYRGPGGHRAMQDWLTGFHEGVASAEASGLRHWQMIPSALAGCSPMSSPWPDPPGEFESLDLPEEETLPWGGDLEAPPDLRSLDGLPVGPPVKSPKRSPAEGGPGLPDPFAAATPNRVEQTSTNAAAVPAPPPESSGRVFIPSVTPHAPTDR